jgi:hypothetical protein
MVGAGPLFVDTPQGRYFRAVRFIEGPPVHEFTPQNGILSFNGSLFIAANAASR